MTSSALELRVFLDVMEQHYVNNLSIYPMISKSDILICKDRLTDFSTNGIETDMLYDIIMEPLVKTSLGHFLYFLNNNKSLKEDINVQEIKEFHPNYVRFQYMDQLIKQKASVTLGSFMLYELAPGTALIDINKLSLKIDSMLVNPILKKLVDPYIKMLKVDGDQIDRILGYEKTRKKPTKGIGILYFVLLDLYLGELDLFIYDTIKASELKIFWCRCLNTALIGFTDKKTVLQFKEIFQLPVVLPAWGLTAKVRSVNRGGRVIRPWRGKLFINAEGILKWERPESIIEM